MEALCPQGQILEQGACWSKCPPQMLPLATDMTQCVVNIPCPPTITRQDVADASVCTKVVFPVNAQEKCTSLNFTQWMPGECLANCPPGFIDNGSSCFKRTQDRMSSQPTCANSFYMFDGSMCQMSSAASIAWYAGILLVLVVFGSFAYRAVFRPANCAPPQRKFPEYAK